MEDLPFDRWPGKQSQQRCPPLRRQEVQAHCQALLTRTCCQPAPTGGSEMAWFPGIKNGPIEVFEVDDIGNDGDDDLSRHYLQKLHPIS